MLAGICVKFELCWVADSVSLQATIMNGSCQTVYIALMRALLVCNK